MAWVCNDPTAFVDEMMDGFVEASRRWVARAPGGVIRSTRSSEPQVAVVIAFLREGGDRPLCRPRGSRQA